MSAGRRLALSTGVTLNVVEAGPADGPPAIFLHGFPESHRTWRGLVPLLSGQIRMIMPDLRGFAGSDKSQDVADYGTDQLVADLFALADALAIDRFALVGHDWGGAVAWAAALSGDKRIERLAILNSPHPAIFQRSIIADEAQRAASQYMRAFREPAMAERIAAMGFDAFFDKSFAPHVDPGAISAEERQRYIDDWSQPGAMTAMLNWYKASLVAVPAVGEEAAMPDWAERGVPPIRVPLLVIWGMDDKALLPVQLDGIEQVGDLVTVVRLDGIGHFAPWEAPGQVAAALGPFLARR